MYPWFERHQDVLARGLAAELALDVTRYAACHVLGAPGIASLTAACIIPDRGIDVAKLERLVDESGNARQRVLLDAARELYERRERVSLGELLTELDGEDFDRVLQAIALVKRRPLALGNSPDDLWIPAAATGDPEREV